MTATFAETLRNRRIRAHLTQEELAERAGISVRTISDLERELNLIPRAATVALLAEAFGFPDAERAEFEAVARGPRPPAPLPATGTAARLPPVSTSFIGREREVEAVGNRLLLKDVRLITLAGPGGTGKTRLAIEVASAVADRFEGGVFFVPLEPIADPALVVPTIATALRVGEVAGRSLDESLDLFLSDRESLVILDNFEQVTKASPLLARLIGECPRLTLLVTSRVLLRLSAEHAYEVPALDLPERGDGLLPKQIQDVEAVRLFVERARAARADFQLTQENASAVAALCRRLDGLPLALELAAARARLLPPAAMLARLEHGLTLLAGGAVDGPHRQRTLLATLDWSYDLLDEPQRRLLRRISVFAGGCDLEAVEAVCRSKGDPEALEGIAPLVDSSLLRGAGREGAAPRFEMLDTIRQYARGRLAESGEAEEVYARHFGHFLDLAETADRLYHSREQAHWLDRLETEHENTRAALQWAIERAEAGETWMADRAARLAGALGAFWLRRSYHSQGRRWLERVLALPGVTLLARARALHSLGLLSAAHGDLTRALAPLEESLNLYREHGDPRRVAWALCGLGGVALDQGEHERGGESCAAALTLFREHGDQVGMAEALHRLGDLAREQGEYERATANLEDALRLYQGEGEDGGVAWALNGLGDVALREANYDLALARYREAMALLQMLGQTWGVAIVLGNLATAAERSGDLPGAAASFERALALAQEIDDEGTSAAALYGLAAVSRRTGDDERAATLYREGLALYRRLGSATGIVRGLEGIAGSLAVRDAPRAARLAGAAHTARGAVGTLAPWDEHADYHRDMAAIRVTLGEEAFATAQDSGRAMPTDQAIAVALSEDHPGQ